VISAQGLLVKVGSVDLMAVKAASRPELAACAAAAARNAQGLLDDAELMAWSARTARAYSLAALAVEECGKAWDLATLALMPEELRAQAPVGKMLQSHQLKMVGGLLIAMLPLGVAPKVDAMTDAELEQAMGTLDEPADEADRLKRRGFYVDMDRNRRIREPSEITESELTSQLGRARQAAVSASAVLRPDAQAIVANPPADSVHLIQELVNALNAAGDIRTPKAAAEVMLRAFRQFRARKSTAGPVTQRLAAQWGEGRAPPPPGVSLDLPGQR
jgi:AbiV family abortive infection protein